MKLKDWLTRKLYVTSPRDPDPFFHPRRYAEKKEVVLEAAHRVLAGLKSWRVEEYRENQGRIHASHFGPFPLPFQDVNLYVVQALDGTSKLEATSSSRAGRGDLGQNRRNLKKFLTRMDALLPPKREG
ncbi:MAG TPA: DUF1499 domain-containing protein [bacterium]|nr:DUF1499 domain-containing protein [bacterium]